MLEHAFRFVDAVIFIIGAKNLRSQRAVAKLGAVLTDETAEGRGDERVVFRLTEGGVREGHAVTDGDLS